MEGTSVVVGKAELLRATDCLRRQARLARLQAARSPSTIAAELTSLAALLEAEAAELANSAGG